MSEYRRDGTVPMARMAACVAVGKNMMRERGEYLTPPLRISIFQGTS
jgi:hypothetical protein